MLYRKKLSVFLFFFFTQPTPVMAYKFLKSRQLRELLDGAEVKQKKDIRDFSGGHLNESILLQHYSAVTRTSWDSAKAAEPMVQRSQLLQSSPPSNRPQMEQALFEFSMGTSGVVPTQPGSKKGRQSPIKKYKFLKEQKAKGGNVDSPSMQSLYSELEDGILVEELPASELMLKKIKDPPPLPRIKSEPSLLVAEDTMYTTQTSILSRQPRHLLHDMPFNYNFLSMHSMGVTRQDQYRKMRAFEANMLKKKEASEQNVLSGVKAVEHHERKLQEVI